MSGRLVHNCGYQGALGALASMGLAYGVEFEKEHGLQIVGAWRRANGAIVKLWGDIEEAAIEAIQSPATTITCGRLFMRFDSGWLRIRLPSGRYLCYPGAQYGQQKLNCRNCGGAGKVAVMRTDEEVELEDCPRCHGRGKTIETVISYMGVNQYTRKWERIATYGGKLTENVVQAGSRDVLAANMQAVEDAGFDTILSVHDELITEVPEDSDLSPEILSEVMTRVPQWAEGLPLAAKGYTARRYKKG